jgi:hypothetical protein
VICLHVRRLQNKDKEGTFGDHYVCEANRSVPKASSSSSSFLLLLLNSEVALF